MDIAIYGAGYVGLVTGICLAELGHRVFCVDIDQVKIAMLQLGQAPIYEQGLQALLEKNLNQKRIQFSTDVNQAVQFSEIQMIAVGTPPLPNGAANLKFVEEVSRSIALRMKDYKLVVTKSTVPVGTADQVSHIMKIVLAERNMATSFDIASNPEFLREGCAVEDFMHPDRIIVGTGSEKALAKLQQLYQPLIDKGYSLLPMSIRSAELTKYAANAFLATKISFINEISQLAERTGADIEEIRKGISMDSRINEKFLNAGCGFGGSCFPKDVAALSHLAIQNDYQAHILRAVINTNKQQQSLLVTKIYRYFQEDLMNKTIAIWGMAFKPNTDDIRCATSLVVIDLLLRYGATLKVYDPMAMKLVQANYPDHPKLIFCQTADDVLDGADALAIVTEWQEFCNPDFMQIKSRLKNPVIFDGRNIYDPNKMQQLGISYFGVGRGKSIHQLKSKSSSEVEIVQ